MPHPQFSNIIVRPLDEYNQKLISNLHSPTWVNPKPAQKYDLVIIGGGRGGLAIANYVSSLHIGLKVALIEKDLIGGNYLNYGSIPSQCLRSSTQMVGDLQYAGDLGVMVMADAPVNFPAVMQRMRRLRERISHNYSLASLSKLGIDVFLGEAKFIDQNYIAVDNIKLCYQKAAIATGKKPHIPPIPGLEAAKYITSKEVFSLTHLPLKLAVIGGGATGCEFAQIFQRLGSQVTLFHRSPLLSRRNSNTGKIIADVLKQEGIRLLPNSQVLRVETNAQGKAIYYSFQGKEKVCLVDEILIATGQTGNGENLNLPAVNVEYSPRLGIKVNDFLQTTNRRIFALGSVCQNGNFTLVSDIAARILVKNALFSPLGIGRQRFQNITPWVVHTDPEVAQVGLSEAVAVSQGINVGIIQISLGSIDSAITNHQESGFLRILHRRGKDEIIGATVVSRHASEIISLIGSAILRRSRCAIANQIGLQKLAENIYGDTPSTAAIKKAAQAYYYSSITPQQQIIWRCLRKLSQFTNKPTLRKNKKH